MSYFASRFRLSNGFVLFFYTMTSLRRYTPYYRVSTQKQGVSGLGLEAQQAAVRSFVSDPSQLLTEFIEIESGKKNQRPQLLAAIAEARRVGSTLLIAKLDRLSRNAGFVFALRDSGVDFVCCDMPDANTLTVGLFAVLAQHERETISKRTKDALAAKKARGAQLGNPQNMTPAITRQGQATMQRNAREHPANRQAAQLATLLREKGQTLEQIAATLTRTGYRTRRGKDFHATSVWRLLSADLSAKATFIAEVDASAANAEVNSFL
ncbi:recombinase family protein [Hymenobacter lucidus]